VSKLLYKPPTFIVSSFLDAMFGSSLSENISKAQLELEGQNLMKRKRNGEEKLHAFASPDTFLNKQGSIDARVRGIVLHLRLVLRRVMMELQNDSLLLAASFQVLLPFHKRLNTLTTCWCNKCLVLCHNCTLKRTTELGMTQFLCSKCCARLRHLQDQIQVDLSYLKEEGELNEDFNSCFRIRKAGEHGMWIVEDHLLTTEELHDWFVIHEKIEYSPKVLFRKIHHPISWKQSIGYPCDLLWRLGLRELNKHVDDISGENSKQHVIRYLRRMGKIDKIHREDIEIQIISLLVANGSYDVALDSCKELLSSSELKVKVTVECLGAIAAHCSIAKSSQPQNHKYLVRFICNI
jgi:hypothetical protein